MRVALFGGTFDPPHRGHVALARLARERLLLDRVLVAPVAVQPLKIETPPAGFADRVAMAELAFPGEPSTEVSLLDAPRGDEQSDFTPNYTVDTIDTLRRRFTSSDALFCIMGADSFLTIDRWHRSADLLAACDFIVGARPGFDLTGAEALLPDGIAAKPLSSVLPNTQVLELENRERRRSRLYLLMDLAEDVSATEIRAALLGEIPPGQVLDPAVDEYIRTHHLYAHL